MVQDLFGSNLSNIAKYVLPATTFAEKEGTFVNHANLAQTIHRANHAPQEARTEGQVALDLLERRLPGQRLAVRKALAKALQPKLRRKGATEHVREHTERPAAPPTSRT